jgi:S1-C subfamily serine protease
MRILIFMVFGALAVIGGEFFYSQGLSFSGPAKAQSPTTGAAPNNLAELTALSDRFETVARYVLPAVVSIEARKPIAGVSPGAATRTTEDSGTGVIVAAFDSPGSIVITNNHVISGARPEQININLADGRLLRPSAVLGDPETDVAVLKVEGSSLPQAKFGESDRLRIGQWVLALGSPFGLSQSVTHGIISARDRGQVMLGNSIRVKDFIQTDAAINPGSSGGPLVNLNGEVIGINTAIASQSGSSAGVSFSIPSNLVRRVAKQLLTNGMVSHGYLGLQLSQSFEPADALSLGLTRARGAKIDSVMPESPAYQAGLRANDVVLQVESVAVRNDNHLINLISMMPAGQKVKMQIWRERKEIAVEAVVGDWNAAKSRIKTTAAR